MYTYSSRFALADGRFRLNPSSSRRVPDEPRRISQEIRVCLDLELRPGKAAPRHRLDRRFGGGFLLALLLHMLCFGLVMAHAYYSLDKPGVVSATGGGASGGIIQLSLVALSAFNGAGAQAPPGQASQEELSMEQSMPQEPSVAEGTASSVAVQKNVPASLTQATRSARKRQPDAARHTATAALTAVQSKPSTTSGGKSAAQTSASATVSDENSGAGTARDSTGASGGLTVFGGSDGPSFKRFVRPEYPAQARRQGITGRVLLRILINAEGVAEYMEVAESAHELLSKAALKAAERSSFYPLKRNGKPVSCWTLLPVSFSLERG